MSATKRTASTVTDFLLYCIGALLYALAICTFVKPNDLVTGGFAGIALLLNRLTGIPVGITVFALNIPLFLLGYRKLGKRFVLASTFATAAVCIFIDIAAPLLPKMHTEKILACIAAGILAGSGLALIFIRGGSTGGADMIGKLLHLRYEHLSVGRIIMAVDTAVIAVSAIVFRNLQNALYSALMIGISAAAVDYFIYGSKSGKLLLAITDKGEEISRRINVFGKRGATLVPVRGAYSGNPLTMLMVVVRAHEIGRIYQILKESDPSAFITLLDARKITGRGFENHE